MSIAGHTSGALLLGEDVVLVGVHACLVRKERNGDLLVTKKARDEFRRSAQLAARFARQLIGVTPFAGLCSEWKDSGVAFTVDTSDVEFVDQPFELDDESFGLPFLAAGLSALLGVPLRSHVMLTGCIEEQSSGEFAVRPVHFDGLLKKLDHCVKHTAVREFFYPEFRRLSGAGYELERWRRTQREVLEEARAAGIENCLSPVSVPSHITLAYTLCHWFDLPALYDKMYTLANDRPDDVFQMVLYLLGSCVPCPWAAVSSGEGQTFPNVGNYPVGIGRLIVALKREKGLELPKVPYWSRIARACSPDVARDLFCVCLGVSDPQDIDEVRTALHGLITDPGASLSDILRWIKLGLTCGEVDRLLSFEDQVKLTERLRQLIQGFLGRWKGFLESVRRDVGLLASDEAGQVLKEMAYLSGVMSEMAEVRPEWAQSASRAYLCEIAAIDRILDECGPETSGIAELESAHRRISALFSSFRSYVAQAGYLGLLASRSTGLDFKPSLKIIFEATGGQVEHAEFTVWPNDLRRKKTIRISHPVLLFEGSLEQSSYSKPRGFAPADDTFVRVPNGQEVRQAFGGVNEICSGTGWRK